MCTVVCPVLPWRPVQGGSRLSPNEVTMTLKVFKGKSESAEIGKKKGKVLQNLDNQPQICDLMTSLVVLFDSFSLTLFTIMSTQ